MFVIRHIFNCIELGYFRLSMLFLFVFRAVPQRSLGRKCDLKIGFATWDFYQVADRANNFSWPYLCQCKRGYISTKGARPKWLNDFYFTNPALKHWTISMKKQVALKHCVVLPNCKRTFRSYFDIFFISSLDIFKNATYYMCRAHLPCTLQILPRINVNPM